MSSDRCVGVLVALSLGCLTPAAARQAATAPAVGTAAIAGFVTEVGSNRPVKLATVWIQVSDTSARTINTDDGGRFAFGGLAPGDYVVHVQARGYVETQYGAAVRGQNGMPITLAEGQRVDRANVALVRCATISGTVRAPLDTRIALGVQLQTWAFSPTTGKRSLEPVSAAMTHGLIDDRGAYRIQDVPPGSYVVLVTSVQEGISGFGHGEIVPAPVIHADVLAALRGALPGAAQTRLDGAAPPPMIWAPTFFPGTLVAADALTITVASGEERTGVDVAVQAVPVGTASGTIVAPPGLTPRNMHVNVFPVEQEAPSPNDLPSGFDVTDAWTFRVPDLRPGRYVATAEAIAPALVAVPGTAPTSLWWAEEPFVVDGRNASNLELVLEPGVGVSGRVQFSPSAPDAATLAQLRIGVSAVAADGRVVASTAPGEIDSRGQFTIGGVTPGRYRFDLTVRDGAPRDGDWWLESAVVDRQNAADTPIDLNAHGPREAILTLTNRARAQLAGKVLPSSAVGDATVIVFSTNGDWWPAPSRRVASALTTADGTFALGALLPGEYLVVALAGVEPNRWLDPDFLAHLAATGPTRVELHAGELVRLTLTVRPHFGLD